MLLHYVFWFSKRFFSKVFFSSGFCAQVGEFLSKTVLVESEETNSDLRVSGNRVTRGLGV